jgi:hypothetical protein
MVVVTINSRARRAFVREPYHWFTDMPYIVGLDRLLPNLKELNMYFFGGDILKTHHVCPQ